MSEERLALLVVDVLSDYDHPDADRLAESAEQALPATVALLGDARERELLTVYVNDTFGDWTLDRGGLLARALDGRHPELVAPLAPPDGTAFLLKGRHSSFWQTPLEFVLREHGVTRVVLCGQTTEQCILYSALDAHVRQFSITVARDACAHIEPDLGDAALRLMERNMHARVVAAAEALELAPAARA